MTTTSNTSNVSAPTTQQTMSNWNQSMSQAWEYYQEQMKMDQQQQAIAFASNVESKGNQMLMACIQNIR